MRRDSQLSTDEKACEPRRLIIQTTSVVAAMFIAGVALGAALVMSKPRQIAAWSQQPVPAKIVPSHWQAFARAE
jgi:hypothetical protein